MGSTLLKFALHLKKISSVFFKYRNDITIYTEDTITDKEFYITLLKRLMNDDVIINDIIQLGCKNTVINSCNSDNIRTGKIYIVDGDLDLIVGETPSRISNLFILDSYCIENYLIDEASSVRLLYYNDVGNEDKIRRILSFDNWLSYNVQILIDLFLHLALSKKLDLGPELKNAHSFLKSYNNQTILDSVKVQIRIDELKNDIISKYNSDGVSSPENEYEKNINELKNKWHYNTVNYLKIVSGKDYLLPLLQFRLQHVIAKSKSLFPIKSIKIFLAGHCDLDRLNSLREFILKNAS